ncbi:MAG TPA: MBL fold metallo-hydrolase [Ktedonobacteraceae bacterium]|nr:MBL fold metallo-hydrolase [Ktedonobacteraceae bacterium]
MLSWVPLHERSDVQEGALKRTPTMNAGLLEYQGLTTMRVISLGSGSSGNALLVEAGARGRTKILVDAGLSSRIIAERLYIAGVHPSQLEAVCVTHEHSDHIIGLPVLMKRYNIPVFSAPETLAAIEQSFASGIWRTDSGTLVAPNFPEAAMDVENNESSELASDVLFTQRTPEKPHTSAFPIGSSRLIGDIEVQSFPTSHDAVSPCGYLLSAGGCRVCIVTDSGEVTPAMLDAMQRADLLILESNHDRQRLLRGPYPYHLKQRILGPNGHLSNDQAAEAVLRTWRPDSARWLWLAHLSRTNNTPKLALNSMLANLEAAHANLSQLHISVLPPGIGGIWDSTQLWHSPALWEM